MCGVIQCDFPNQMNVFRWLISDSSYRCIYITHDKDIILESRDRQLEDGTIQHLNVGDLKPPHIHIIIKLSNRLLPETFSKRFGNYVNFLACADSREYARYLTHETFGSQDKARYDRAEIQGDLDYYFSLVNTSADSSNDVIRRVCHAAEICGSRQSALDMLIQNHDVYAVKSLMSHAYFYNCFVFD